MKKFITRSLAALLTISMLAACADTGGGTDSGTTTTPPPGETGGDTDTGSSAYVPLASDAAGEITIMMWSGDGSFLKDIGHQNYAPEDLLGQNNAAAYATAKAFNEIYPNIKINIYAVQDGPDDNGSSWAQKREDFRNEYGVYPDMYAATDVPGDIEKGLIADLSVFANDPVYQTFNPAVMEMMNYNGAQFALPQYLLPWGVFVNKSLANAKNIDIPDPDWTIDEYTEFTSHSSPDEYYGAYDVALDIIRTGSKDFAYNLVYRGENDPYVNLNSDYIKKLLSYVPEWSKHAVNPQFDIGNISQEFIDANWSWGFAFFMFGNVLTLANDPWMMGDLAHPNPEHWGAAQMDDWDYYPRPATDEIGPTVGVVLDPWAFHNYAMDDGNPELSDDEYAKMQIMWEFAKFWVGDTRAWKARAEQMFLDDGTLKTSMNDSFPLVVGDAFDEQMDIWFSTETHQRFGDKEKMPGFQAIIELWQAGEFADVSDKAYPWYYEVEGASQTILYEWLNSWDANVSGAMRTDANWLDQVYARLPDWNTAINTRFADKFESVSNALKTYYGK